MAHLDLLLEERIEHARGGLDVFQELGLWVGWVRHLAHRGGLC